MKLPEFWKTGVAVLLLAGLVSYYWFVERKTEPKPEGERAKVTVCTLDRAKAKEITLSAPATATIRLQKEGGSWTLAAPTAAPADAGAVDSMLTQVEKLEADEVVAEQASDLAQYGLATPSRTVSVSLEGSKDPVVVQFGAKAPDGSSLYAKTAAASKIYLIPSWIESSFDKKPFDLRDRDILHVKRDDVRSMEVTGPEGGYALARTDAGDWAFTKPIATRAGRWAVDGLLGTIENLRMDSVAAEEAKDAKEIGRFGLEKPSRSVTLVTKDGQAHTLEVGNGIAEPAASPSPSPSPAGKPEKPKPSKYYVRRAGSGLVALVPATLVEDLAKGMGELRAKRLLEVATYETESFEVTAAGKKKTYTKATTKEKDGFDKTQWKRTSPDAKDVDTTKVEDALFKLGGVEVTEFVDQPQDPAAYGLDAPILKVTVKSKGESSIEVAKKEGAYYARRSSDASLLKLDPAKAEELVKTFGEI